MLQILISIIVLASILLPAANANNLIPYEVTDETPGHELGVKHVKLYIDVVVDLVDDRLPTDEEMLAIAQRLVDESRLNQERSQWHLTHVIRFYLPGLHPGLGVFASLSHDPIRDPKLGTVIKGVLLGRNLTPDRYKELIK